MPKKFLNGGRHLIADIDYSPGNYIICTCGWKGDALPETNYRQHILDSRGTPATIITEIEPVAPGVFLPSRPKHKGAPTLKEIG